MLTVVLMTKTNAVHTTPLLVLFNANNVSNKPYSTAGYINKSCSESKLGLVYCPYNESAYILVVGNYRVEYRHARVTETTAANL